MPQPDAPAPPQQPTTAPGPRPGPPVAYRPFVAGGHRPITPPPVRPPQRPAPVTVSVVMIVTASMMWIVELAFVWLVVFAGRESFGYEGVEGALFHMLERFHLKMVDGLAWVLFGFPLAATVLAFFLLLRRAWPRIAVSVLGGLAIGTTAVMLSNNLRWVAPGAVYVAFTCVLLWVPSVTRWISEPSRRSR